jgi:hypothetical protein
MTLDSTPPIFVGPTKTSRLGNSLILDVAAPQGNLVVERGSIIPRASLIVTTAARNIIEHSKAGEKAEHIVVHGSAEDVLYHPGLKEIVDNLKALRTKWYPRAKTCLFTNAFDVDNAVKRLMLGAFDKLFVHYEWTTAKDFASATGRKSTDLAILTKTLTGQEHLIVQSRFWTGDLANSTAKDVEAWCKKVCELKPLAIHVIGGEPTVKGKKMKGLTPSKLEKLAVKIADLTGLTVLCYPQQDAALPA